MIPGGMRQLDLHETPKMKADRQRREEAESQKVALKSEEGLAFWMGLNWKRQSKAAVFMGSTVAEGFRCYHGFGDMKVDKKAPIDIYTSGKTE